MSTAPDPNAEDLLAEALAAFDAGGEPALAQFLAAHPERAGVLERGIQRCREMGLLGAAGKTDFPERLDDFRLLRRIGGGGMGVVYEAEQVHLGRRVALKVIRPELLFFEGARERFRREVDAIAKLSHPAIVPVLASGEHDGVPYFAMELLTGATAEEACAAVRGRDPGSLTGADLRAAVGGGLDDDTGQVFAGPWWQACTRLVHQVALGMRHAHLRGIVHRDLKPSNVMLTPHGQAIVLDFGVAQFGAGRDLTRSGATPGSPAFMSPEQLRGEATDERTDVYSIAATLWQMLTLQRPFAEARQHAHIQEGHLPRLTARNRAVPRELELVLRTAMDRDRERRYGDIGAFAADLVAVLQRKPIAARPLGVGLRLLRWCQRHRVAATALLALVVAAAAVPAALAWQQRAANASLRAEQVRTKLSLETSLDALHAVLVRLGNDQLRNVPLAEQIAHEALVDAAELYRKLLAQHPEHERVRVQGGRALHALSMSFERQGKVKEAIATVREAIAMLDGDAMDRSPALIDIRAHANMGLASVLTDSHDTAGAHAAIDAAERDFLAIAEVPRYALESLRGRANLHTTRSILFDERTQATQAEASLRAAIASHAEVLARGGTDGKDPSLHVSYLANLAKFLTRQNRDAEAQAAFEAALQHAEKLVPAPGLWPPPSVTLAEVQEGLGGVLSRQQSPEAETYLRAALASREQAVAQFPKNNLFRIQMGGTLHNYGLHLFRQLGQAEEALAWFARARDCQREALAKTPTNRQARLYLANHLRMLGQCQASLQRGSDLAATAQALADLDDDPQTALNAALLFAQAQQLADDAPAGNNGRATEFAEAALALLARAEQGGVEMARALDSPVFRPLHGHAAWTALQQRARDRAATGKPAGR